MNSRLWTLFAALAALLLAMSAVAQENSLERPVITVKAGERAIEISWEPIPGADQYELWVWPDNVTGWVLIDKDLTATRFSDEGRTGGARYWYAVRALSSAGETSSWSEYGSAVAPVLPTQTATPTATPTWDNSVPGIPGGDSQFPQTDTPTPTATPTSVHALTAVPTVTLTPTHDNSFPVTPDRNAPRPSPTHTPIPTLTPVPDDCILTYRVDKVKMALRPVTWDWFYFIFGELPTSVVLDQVWYYSHEDYMQINYIVTDSSGQEIYVREFWDGCLFLGFDNEG